MKKRSGALLVVLAMLALAVLALMRCEVPPETPPKEPEPEAAPVGHVPAPVIEGKIKGYWASQGPSLLLSSLRRDEVKMKAAGINTITFSPALSHTQEGAVREQRSAEQEARDAIEKVHAAGFQVTFETTPMGPHALPRVTDVELFQKEMKAVALKYAAIAEEYAVAYFTPIVEPAHHMGVEEADEWMQEMLPLLREVYSGKLMWKKQDRHLTDLKKLDFDHSFEIEFTSTGGFGVNMKNGDEGKLTLSYSEPMLKLERYPGGQLIAEEEISAGLDEWHAVRIEQSGKNVAVYLDDELKLEAVDSTGPEGGLTLSSFGARFRNAKLDGAPLGKLSWRFVDYEVENAWSWDGDEMVGNKGGEANLVHDIDFSGYDFIAIDTFRRGQAQTNEEYLDYVEFIIQNAREQAAADGVPKIIIAEFGGSTLEEIGWHDSDVRDKMSITNEDLAEVTQGVLLLAEDLDGWVYNGWDISGQGINQIPEVEAVIRDWYNSH